jgi:hypothetical protein
MSTTLSKNLVSTIPSVIIASNVSATITEHEALSIFPQHNLKDLEGVYIVRSLAACSDDPVWLHYVLKPDSARPNIPVEQLRRASETQSISNLFVRYHLHGTSRDNSRNHLLLAATFDKPALSTAIYQPKRRHGARK